MPNRKSLSEIRELQLSITKNPVLQTILAYAPIFVGVLNTQRQFVFMNERFFQDSGLAYAADRIGMRPGEVLHCVHHREASGGCGHSFSCRYCGLLRPVLDALRSGRSQKGEVRLSTDRDGTFQAWDLSVHVEPIVLEGESLLILFMRDISDEKRKALIERVFFHDVMNSVASLHNLFHLLHPDDEDDPEGLLRMMRLRLSDISEQIHYQKRLVQAERGSVVPDFQTVDLYRELQDIIEEERLRFVHSKKQIEIHLQGASQEIVSDKTLLRRIIVNMLKNAREGEIDHGKRGPIQVSLRSEDDCLWLVVQNSAVMEAEVRSQIFQRSFSTKGPGRGLGTYSMKLLAKQYLQGDIDFYSEEGSGTVFRLQLPLRPKLQGS